jgi:hypothetical protein
MVRGYKKGFDVAIIDHSPSSDIKVSWQSHFPFVITASDGHNSPSAETHLRPL